jgi:Holliday junction DNA helicase RuvA
MTVDAFLMCVEAEDVESLVRVPGIGRKTAERLVIEMRDRIRAFGEVPAAGAALPGGAAGPASEAYAAMVALGYRPAEVVKLLKKVTTEGSATEDIIREALKLAVSK